MKMHWMAAAALLTGCTSLTGGEDDDSRGDQHSLTINWNVRNADGSPHSCAPPFDTLLIVVTGLGDGLERGAYETIKVPCTATGSQTASIYTSGSMNFKMEGDPTTYTNEYFPTQEVVIFNTEDTGMNIRAESIASVLTLDGDKTVTVDLYPEAGFAMKLWQIKSMATDSWLRCEAGDVDQVSYTYRDFNDVNAPMVTDTWSCDNVDPDFPYLSEGLVFDAGNGRTRALVPGSYIGTMRALRNGTEVGREDDSEMMIETGNKVTRAGSSTLVILDR